MVRLLKEWILKGNKWNLYIIVQIGILLLCDVIQKGEGACAAPPSVSNGTYTPVQANYLVNETVTYTCNTGYQQTDGDLLLTCDPTDNWVGTQPTCTIVNCTEVVEPNTSKSPDQASYNYNTAVTYTCDVGYQHTSGDLVRTCLSDTTWNGTKPVCTVVNCTEVVEPNTSKSPDQASYNYNTAVTYTCDVGYQYTSGDLVRTCLSDTTWNGTKPVCTVVNCTEVVEPNTSKSPDQASYNYNTAVTYTCDVGYQYTSGNLVRTCLSDTTWNGTKPICTIKTCVAPPTVEHATISPVQASYNYSTDIVYTCDAGFKHDSGDLTRTCTDATTWDRTAPVFVLVTCPAPSAVNFATVSHVEVVYNYSDVITYTCDTGYEITAGSISRTCQQAGTFSGSAPVCSIKTCSKIAVTFGSASPDQTLYDYDTNVTYSCNLGYNHTAGDLVRTCNATAQWTGTLPICTVAACLPVSSTFGAYTPVQITYEFFTSVLYSCDAGYYHSAGNLTRTCQNTGLWNGTLPTCSRVTCPPPGAVTDAAYTPALGNHDYDTTVTYTCNLAHNHTDGNLTRTCQQDFTWSGSTPVCTVAACIQELPANMIASPNKVLHEFNDDINYACAIGYNHSSGDLTRTCQTTGAWTGTVPACVIVTCTQPNIPAHSTISPNIPESNYNTDITYTCDLGYNRTGGDATRTCNETGEWGGTEANCTLVTCMPPPTISDGAYSPMQSVYNYSDVVTYICDFGYYHNTGNLARSCNELAAWTGNTPTCPIVTCTKIVESHASASPDTPTYDFNTTVTYTCDLGYNLTAGDSTRTCLHIFSWDGTPPNCTIITCPQPSTPIHSTISPNIPESDYNTTITYTCDLGYNRTSGDETRRCTETRAWEGVQANCTLVTCFPPSSILYGTYSPAISIYNYSDTVTYSCDFGYNHTAGVLTLPCNEFATWTGDMPTCSIVICNEIVEAHATKTPDTATYDFNTTVAYTCDLGYNLTAGDDIRTCQHTGIFDGSSPNCTIITCPQPSTPIHSTISPNIPESDYNTTITYTCNLGYNRTSGDETRRCTETRAWEGVQANCTLVTCDPPVTILDGTYSPAILQYNYSDVVTYSCDVGYNHSGGSLTLTCNELALWIGVTPVCSIVTCPQIVEAHSSMVPNTATYDYNTAVTYTCDLGYNLTSGDDTRTCQHTGVWNGSSPNCTIITCPQPSTPIHSTISPNIAESDYNTTITYTCNLGYNRTSGDETRRCTETRAWEGVQANCTLVTCPPPTILANSSFSPALSTYNYTDTVTYACDFGYYLDSGDLTHSCNENATWTGTPPVCPIVTCTQVTIAHSSMLPSQPKYDFNTTVTYTCDLGYNRTDGDETRTCQHNFTWGGTPPNCTLVTCPQPYIPSNTSVSPDVPLSDYNTTITYTCDLGYNRTGGDETRRCTETRAWTGEGANCTLVTCPPPTILANSSFSPALSTYNYTDIVTYACDFGYYLDSGDLTHSCNEHATWTGTPPVCPIVTCTQVTIDHSNMLPSQPKYDFNTSVTYTCDLGYNRTDGDETRTCQHNFTWGGTPPNCTLVTCPQPYIPSNTSVSPDVPLSDYNTTITYTCDLGYNRTGGDETRRCTETRAWTGEGANCTLVTCPPPTTLANSSFSPALSTYNYTDTVTYACDFGYYLDSGDLTHSCNEHATWTGTPPVCPIVTCTQVTIAYASMLPSQPKYDFNTTVTYTCDLGYNRTDGDETRTCQHNFTWGGTPPNCTLITCDPPAPIAYTQYVPVLLEHDWNTAIDYTCDADYHYVSGISQTTCNETGEFPPVDFDCSVLHTLTLHPSEPAVQWINATNPFVEIEFVFDGLCDVVLDCTPDRLDLSHTRNGTRLFVAVNETTGTKLDEYIIELSPFRNTRTFPTINTTVFYGDEVLGLNAWINNPINYLEVGKKYQYEANLTQGTTVTIDWTMEVGVTLVDPSKIRVFTTAKVDHTYNSPGTYIIAVRAWNLVSSQTVYITVIVIYPVNNLQFTVDNTLQNTTTPAEFNFTVLSSADIPMDVCQFHINHKHGANSSNSHTLNGSLGLPVTFLSTHLFDTQGVYDVEACGENILNSVCFTLTVNVWDKLDSLILSFFNGSGNYVTNNPADFIFMNPPNGGFKYSIDYGDTTSGSYTSDEIMYRPYNLTTFTHHYTAPGNYTVTWTAENNEYSETNTLNVLVQNRVPNTGYTLEPSGVKYPWSTIQDMDISLNITLNSSTPEPTDATCDFNPDDGGPIVTGHNYNSAFFHYITRYSNESVYSPTFNCSNVVSDHTYQFNFEVIKFDASFLTVIVPSVIPLNFSNSVEVFFRVNNSGFALLPLQVTLAFDFGDGSPVMTVPYDQDTYSHIYSERKDYIITVTTNANTTNTSNTLTYPLRVGVMRFEYSDNIAFINHTLTRYDMYGVQGLDTNYTMSFDDGSPDDMCNSVNDTGCSIHHYCISRGYRLVQVIASNGTFVEVDNVNITCENPFNVTLNMSSAIEIPDGQVDLQLSIAPGDLVVPVLTCEFNMGDPVNRDTYTEIQEVTDISPMSFNFQYIAIGWHRVSIHCWNLINDTYLEHYITVTNNDFVKTGVFDRQYSQVNEPMLISSMLDTEIFSRLEIAVNHTIKTHANYWRINATVGSVRNRHSLLFTRGSVDEIKYKVVLEINFVEETNNTLFEPTYIQFVIPPPHAEIVGGQMRVVNRGVVLVDALTLSYDPVSPQLQNLGFVWECAGYTATAFEEAAQSHNNGDPSSSCSFSITANGIANLDTTANPQKPFYVMTVKVTNSRNLQSTYLQIMQIDTANELSIKCVKNCLSKVALSSKLHLMPYSATTQGCLATTYTWSVQQKNGTIYDPNMALTDISVTGAGNNSLIIREHALLPGTWYLVTLYMDLGGVTYGPAYYEFATNQPPRNGNCSITLFDESFLPTSTVLTNVSVPIEDVVVTTAEEQLFNISCMFWEDEGFTQDNFTNQQPLFYYFFFTYMSDANERQVLYFDPGSTANLVTFGVGDRNDGYRGQVTIRVMDVLGDYAEEHYSVISQPKLTTATLSGKTTAEQLANISSYLQRFDDSMIKASRTWDYRTLSRRMVGIASIYNRLFESSLSAITLTPEDLLSLGNKRDNDGNLLTWSDYMTLIVEGVDTSIADHLSKTGENYVSMLHESIVTWPSGKRITLVAIETASRALNATFVRSEYSNVSAAILAAQCADLFAQSLVSYASDRTFPNAEILHEALMGVLNLINSVLRVLQTVLTPDLPFDPTADEMRNFLEYMRVYKTDEEILSEPLSLQEQTFLAQKQLQKYSFQKYQKEIASQQGLPFVENALDQLTSVLEKMSYYGEGVRSLESNNVYISSEILPVRDTGGGTLTRPRVSIDIPSISDLPAADDCQDKLLTARTIIYRPNPFFWSTYGDRITSDVPVYKIDTSITSSKVTYRLANKEIPLCTLSEPTYDEQDPNKMIYILFDRRHIEDDILLYINPNTTHLVYQVYMNEGSKPSIEQKQYQHFFEILPTQWNTNDGYKVIIKSQDFPYSGSIYVGLRPMLEKSSDRSMLTRPFCVTISSVSCLMWKKNSAGDSAWDNTVCEVSPLTNKYETVCECQNDGSSYTVASTFYVPPSKIDYLSVSIITYTVGRDPLIGLIIATLVAYVLMLAWAWREDIKDQYKFSYSLLIDNDIADSNFFIVRVYTGLRSGSGTKSNIAFILVGERNDTGIRMLDDEAHVGFDRGSVRTFVMSSRRSLGDLICLRLWHDDTGLMESAWYLNKVTVQDIQSGKRYTFMCDRWFDYDHGDTRVDRVLNAQHSEDVKSMKDLIAYTVAEHHIWISIMFRPFRSSFTRQQRLSCLIGMVYITMIICTMVVKTPDVNQDMQQVVIGPFRFSMDNVLTSLFAVSIASLVIFVASLFFKNAEASSNCNNPFNALRRAYRKVNSYIKLDKSMATSTYIPPAEEAVQYNYFWFPHICVFIGWAIIGMAVVVVTYILVAFSNKWRLIKSEEWMSAVLCSFMESFLIIETVKITIIVFLYWLFNPAAYEPPEPSVNMDNLKEITKHNSASMNVAPEFSNVLKPARSPDEETLLKNKIKRISNHQILRIFYQLVVYSGILYIVYTISYESRDPGSYLMKNHIENIFQFKEEVHDIASYTRWLNGRFLNTYFTRTFFGANYTNSGRKIFMEDLINVRVGPARLRQLRIKAEDCQGPLGVDLSCYNKYVSKKAETHDYCLGWKPEPCDVSEKSDSFSSAAWLYTSPDQVWGFTTIAEYNSYGAGGYFMKLDVNRDVCLIIFNELIEHLWFNRQTKAVILEFTVYNANSNLFAYSKFVAEFPEVGSVIPYMDIQVFRLYTHSGPDGDFILFLQFVFLLLVIAATVKFVYDMTTDPRTYFKSVWNIFDLLALIMAYITVSIFIYKMFIIQKTLEIFHNDQNAYVGFENLAFYDFVVNTSYGVLVFLLSVRVSRILGYSGKINEMADVISNAADDLIGFCVIFTITYWAYVATGTLLFGKETEKYKDMFQSYGTLTEAIIGKNRLENILDVKPVFAEFYYFTLVLFVLLTLSTMAAAILNFSISHVREEQRQMKQTSIIEVIVEKIVTFLKSFGGSPENGSTPSDRGRNDRRNSDNELNELITDFQTFIRDVLKMPEDEEELEKKHRPDGL